MSAKDTQSMTVNLDRLITRASLRYRRSDEQLPERNSENDYLRVRDLSLTSEDSITKYLRKPDFQRATSSWSPEECVALLESIVNGQVVPSIVMWNSPDELNYILDGAHRISAIIAWLSDNWGDKDLPDTPASDDESEYEDEDEYDEDDFNDRRNIEAIKAAAREVRKLVKQRVGLLSEFEEAERRSQQLQREGKSARDIMGKDFEKVLFYRRFRKGESRLHILWANGDYRSAESSFLRINKGGKPLKEWERKVVEERDSSFVRTIMSIANIESVRHYWPKIDKPTDAHEQDLANKVKEIHQKIGHLHSVLFTPEAPRKFKPIPHPFFWTPETDERPGYLAELLCVTSGFKGQKDEVEKLIAQSKGLDTTQIVKVGWALVDRANEAFEHLAGATPRSLAIIPLLYFYSEKGKHVRSLLYGFLYWMLRGKGDDILNRKRAFSAYREPFEQILFERKKDIVSGNARKTGSGPEVTVRVAKYYQDLLNALIQHRGDYHSDTFSEMYRSFTKPLVSRESALYRELESKRRLFTPAQEAVAKYTTFFGTHTRCPICGARIDLTGSVNNDHREDHAKGGPTSLNNLDIVHPFCNGPETKKLVRAVKEGRLQIDIPPLAIL